MCLPGDSGDSGATLLIPESGRSPGVGNDNPGDTGDSGATLLIPESGRSPGVGNDNPLKYSCLENPMDRWAWWATVHVVTKS